MVFLFFFFTLRKITVKLLGEFSKITNYKHYMVYKKSDTRNILSVRQIYILLKCVVLTRSQQSLTQKQQFTQDQYQIHLFLGIIKNSWLNCVFTRLLAFRRFTAIDVSEYSCTSIFRSQGDDIIEVMLKKMLRKKDFSNSKIMMVLHD